MPSHPDFVQICEINARFAFNGFFNTAFAHLAIQENISERQGLKSPVDPNKVSSHAPVLL